MQFPMGDNLSPVVSHHQCQLLTRGTNKPPPSNNKHIQKAPLPPPKLCMARIGKRKRGKTQRRLGAVRAGG